MTILFLDIDGVLNTEADRHPNRYLPINREKAYLLNEVLAAAPEAKLVISSAWRYHALSGRMTLKGFEEMLCHFGMNAFDRVIGVTDCDDYHYGDPAVADWTKERWHADGLLWRARQIREFVTVHDVQRFAVLDDLPLDLPELVRTDREVGLTRELAGDVVRQLLGSIVVGWRL